MVISGNYEAASDEQIWGASEFVDILMEDQAEAQSKKKRQMSGFVMPRKRETKLKSPKKGAEGSETQLSLQPTQQPHLQYQQQQQLAQQSHLLQQQHYQQLQIQQPIQFQQPARALFPNADLTH